MSKLGIDSCLVDVFITPGVRSQTRPFTIMESILIRKLGLGRKRWEKLQVRVQSI
jgi:hypothetical protein